MALSFENSRYTSTQWLEAEKSAIFGKLWIFFCLKSQVDKPDRFVARDLLGVPVVVQNIDGTISAFANVCLHRQNRLQSIGAGRGPLICPYHAWRYGKDGEVVRLPLNDSYHQLSQDKVESMRLRQYAVCTVGEFLFINLSGEPLPIEEQYSEQLLADLTSMSEKFDREILIANIKCHYNWKLIYENLRDSIHPRFLHTRTLTRDVVIDHSPPEHLADDYIPTLKELSSGGGLHDHSHDMTPGYGDKIERWGEKNAYFTWLLFPNTHVISPNGGYAFSIEHHMPTAPGETDLTLYFLTGRQKRPLPASVLLEHLRGAKKVLDEDNGEMERVQSVVNSAVTAPVLGAGEADINRLHRWMAANVSLTGAEGVQ